MSNLTTNTTQIEQTNNNDNILDYITQQYDKQPKLLYQGAEGRIYTINYKLNNNDNDNNNTTIQQYKQYCTQYNITYNNNDTTVQCILKHRFSKKYRHPKLDDKLNNTHIKNEVKAIEKLHKHLLQQQHSKDNNNTTIVNMLLPYIFYSNYYYKYIIMSYLSDYITVRSFLNEHCNNLSLQLLSTLCYSIGRMLSMLHSSNIVHGDLTTSNILIHSKHIEQIRNIQIYDASEHAITYNNTCGDTTDDIHTTNNNNNNKSTIPTIQYYLSLIDFGLCSFNGDVESKAVDLYVLERCFYATHNNADICITYIMKGYRTHDNDKILTRLDKVRLRGRKRSMLG